MPSPRVLDLTERAPEPTGVEELFSKVAKLYKEDKDQDTIGKILADAEKHQGEKNNFENTVRAFQKAPINPTKRLELIKQEHDIRSAHNDEDKALLERYKAKEAQDEKLKKEKIESDKVAKADAKEKADRAAVISENEIVLTNAGYPPEEVKRLSPLMTTAGTRALVKPQKTANGPKERFEQGLAAEAAKEVPELEKEIKKSDDLIANVDAAEKLANDELGGPIGYGKAFFNTQSASNLETLGATNLGSVIKLFNPAGTLPTAKLNWIKKTFAVSPYDTLSTMKGKFDTQRIILNQAKARAQERVGLLKKYFGNIPEDVNAQFDRDTGDLLDALKDELEPSKEDAHKGMVKVMDPNGIERWVPEDVAKKLKAK